MGRVRTLTAAAMWAVALGAPAEAQILALAPPALRSPSSLGTAQPSAPRAHRWEIEGLAGLSLARLPVRGSSSLPTPGPLLTTSSPIFATRQTSSWFFGDGAALLNDVNAEFGLPNRMVPLDSALASFGLESANVPVVGFRVRRTLTPRLSAEFSVDAITGSGRVTSEFRTTVESSRTSFESVFGGLLSIGPFAGVIVGATAATIDGSSREVAATGALNMHFAPRGEFVPYVTLGGGLISGAGTLPSVTLEGNYRFAIDGVIPVDETDRVTLRFKRDTTAIAVLGGGLRRDMSGRWGFRIDGRVLLGGGHRVRLLLDANPTVSTRTPAGFIESFTSPSIQFSNNTSTGRRSSLSGPAIQDFAVFTGGGIETRTILTVGVFRRF